MIKTIFFLLLCAAVLGLKLTSDSYIQLPPEGYAFTCTPTTQAFRIKVGQMPPGLALDGHRLVAVEGIRAGQYIISVKAVDEADPSQHDEQIVIVNVESEIPSFVPSTVASGTASTLSTTSMSQVAQQEDLESMFGGSETGSGSSDHFGSRSAQSVQVAAASSSGSLDIDELKSFFGNEEDSVLNSH